MLSTKLQRRLDPRDLRVERQNLHAAAVATAFTRHRAASSLRQRSDIARWAPCRDQEGGSTPDARQTVGRGGLGIVSARRIHSPQICGAAETIRLC